MPDYSSKLRKLVEGTVPKLLALTAEQAVQAQPSSGWSVIELVGHLIDSASVNHERFVRAQFKDDLVFEGYDQARWVELQSYASADWPGVVELWRASNLHIAHVMENTPSTVRERSCARHSLDRIAWAPVQSDQPATLDYLMNDYVEHLGHHLSQLPI